jgi:hypothetical protein
LLKIENTLIRDHKFEKDQNDLLMN